MIKLKILTLFCSLFLTLLSAGELSYQESMAPHIYKNMDYLELTLAQENDIKAILLSCKKEFSKYYEKKEKAQKKLQQLMQKEYFNEKEYEDIAEDIAEEAIELEIKIFKQLHTILTPQQREMFSNYLLEWKIE